MHPALYDYAISSTVGCWLGEQQKPRGLFGSYKSGSMAFGHGLAAPCN